MKGFIGLLSLVLWVAFLGFSCGSSEHASHVPLNRNDGWPLSTPADQGVDPQVVDRAYRSAERIRNLYSFLVVRNGHLIAERYFNGSQVEAATPSASVTKSYISALTGIALGEGALSSLDQKMMDFFPELDWQAMDARKSQITLRHILAMRSGYPWEEMDGYLAPLFPRSNWIPLIAEFPLKADPGTRYGYSNFTAHVMAIILSRATHADLLEYARIHLFEPLDVTVESWPVDGNGYRVGHGDIAFIPRDMARFGLLYLNGGRFAERQILTQEWVDASLATYSQTTYPTEILSSLRGLQYGYLWWSSTAGCRHCHFAWGHGGQLVFVIEDLNMVVVTSAEYLGAQFGEDAWAKEKAVMELVGEFISSM